MGEVKEKLVRLHNYKFYLRTKNPRNWVRYLGSKLVSGKVEFGLKLVGKNLDESRKIGEGIVLAKSNRCERIFNILAKVAKEK